MIMMVLMIMIMMILMILVMMSGNKEKNHAKLSPATTIRAITRDAVVVIYWSTFCIIYVTSHYLYGRVRR